MKKFLSIIVLLLTVTMSAMAVTVDEAIDLGALSLDTDYALATFKGYKASFTAPKTGVLTMSSTTTDDLAPYSDAACTQSVSCTKNTQYGAHTYDMNVEEGVTYYFFSSFVMNSNTTVRITMPGKQEITLESSSPAIGGTFNVSNGGQISFNFSKAVAYTGATITIGTKTQALDGLVSSSSIFFNSTKELIWDALNDGTLKPGDTFTITLNGVCMASDSNILYDGTGTLVADFIVGKMPITLVSTENTTGEFLSYYTTDNAKGIVKFTFSGKVNPEKLTAVIKYGNVDKDPDGGYYYETLTPEISDDGNTVIVNLQGKRRKVADMISTDDTYNTISLGITGVLDEDGNYAYSASSGSLGSYWYNYDYKEINAKVFADFTPAAGSVITTSTQNLEIWVTDENMLTYDGIEFAYDAASSNARSASKETILVTDYTKEADPEDNTATILTVPVPDAVKTAKNIVVSFRNLQCADGTDYSSTLRAEYNVADPSGIEEIENGELKVENTPCYNVSGQRISASAKGIIIRNGKKMVR